ncbi:CU044_2847 family protein [Streptomyces sp. NPDC058637]|uniref:CU044_2847 family protein n=1 Tax=Streptomyces sp. NPDC058637 TaxID=3346569 RepID=UPI00364DA1A3
MGDSAARITRIEMPDGTPVWARISGAEELGEPAGGPTYTDIGYEDLTERIQARVESLTGVVTSVARSLAEPLRAVRPDEVSVEFGIELTAKAGKVVGLLADGEAKGAIKVTLTWSGGGPPDAVPPPPDAVPPPATAVPPPATAVPPPATPHLTAASPPAAPQPPSTPPPPTSPPVTTPPDGAPPGGPSAGASTGAPAHPHGGGAPGGGGS